jgi:16S rRNA (guanine527-N7)-methyltransferase
VRGSSRVRAGEFDALEGDLEHLGLAVPPGALEVLRAYRDGIVEWNAKVNLVSRRDMGRLVDYHFLDCASGLRFVREGDVRVLDLGSGAGFPGLVWRILRASLIVDLVESVRKKTLFLEGTVRDLALTGVRVVRERGEALAEREGFTNRYDVATARTVAPLPDLVRTCMPLLRKGGRLVAFKGERGAEEVEKAAAALSDEGGRVVEMAESPVRRFREKRSFVVAEKL